MLGVDAVAFWPKGLIAAWSRLWDGAILNSDPLKSLSWWTEGVHLFVSHGSVPVVILLLLPGSSFGSVMCIHGGEAGEEQEHFHIQGTAPDLQVWSSDFFKGSVL